MARKNGNVTQSTELVIQENNQEITDFVPSNQVPDYLRDTDGKTGLETLTKDDFKIPEIKLLQPLSPEVKTFQGVAIPGEYWHTGLMKSLGKSYRWSPIIVRKRIILWRPKNDQGGGIIARSDDCINWAMGSNTRFTIKLKDVKDPVIWDTKRSVRESGLLNFGSSNPDIQNSTPAAVLYYEYLQYLHDYESASPALQRVFKTGVDSAKSLNAYFLLQKKKINAHVIKAFVDERSKDGNEWYVPKFSPAGFVPTKELFDSLVSMSNQYSDYEVDMEQADDIDWNKDKPATEATKTVDEIPF